MLGSLLYSTRNIENTTFLLVAARLVVSTPHLEIQLARSYDSSLARICTKSVDSTSSSSSTLYSGVVVGNTTLTCFK